MSNLDIWNTFLIFLQTQWHFYFDLHMSTILLKWKMEKEDSVKEREREWKNPREWVWIERGTTRLHWEEKVKLLAILYCSIYFFRFIKMSDQALRKMVYKCRTLKHYDRKEIKDNIKKIKFKMVAGEQFSISLSFRVNSRFNFNHTQKHELILMALWKKNCLKYPNKKISRK